LHSNIEVEYLLRLAFSGDFAVFFLDFYADGATAQVLRSSESSPGATEWVYDVAILCFTSVFVVHDFLLLIYGHTQSEC